MAAKGVEKIKSVVTTVKLGVISVAQAISKDGFQVDDVLAPLGSKIFMDQARTFLTDAREAALEVADLDVIEGFQLFNHLNASYKDVKTEVTLAIVRLKAQKATKLAA